MEGPDSPPTWQSEHARLRDATEADRRRQAGAIAREVRLALGFETEAAWAQVLEVDPQTVFHLEEGRTREEVFRSCVHAWQTLTSSRDIPPEAQTRIANARHQLWRLLTWRDQPSVAGFVDMLRIRIGTAAFEAATGLSWNSLSKRFAQDGLGSFAELSQILRQLGHSPLEEDPRQTWSHPATQEALACWTHEACTQRDYPASLATLIALLEHLGIATTEARLRQLLGPEIPTRHARALAARTLIPTAILQPIIAQLTETEQIAAEVGTALLAQWETDWQTLQAAERTNLRHRVREGITAQGVHMDTVPHLLGVRDRLADVHAPTQVVEATLLGEGTPTCSRYALALFAARTREEWAELCSQLRAEAAAKLRRRGSGIDPLLYAEREAHGLTYDDLDLEKVDVQQLERGLPSNLPRPVLEQRLRDLGTSRLISALEHWLALVRPRRVQDVGHWLVMNVGIAPLGRATKVGPPLLRKLDQPTPIVPPWPTLQRIVSAAGATSTDALERDWLHWQATQAQTATASLAHRCWLTHLHRYFDTLNAQYEGGGQEAFPSRNAWRQAHLALAANTLQPDGWAQLRRSVLPHDTERDDAAAFLDATRIHDHPTVALRAWADDRLQAQRPHIIMGLHALWEEARLRLTTAPSASQTSPDEQLESLLTEKFEGPPLTANDAELPPTYRLLAGLTREELLAARTSENIGLVALAHLQLAPREPLPRPLLQDLTQLTPQTWRELCIAHGLRPRLADTTHAAARRLRYEQAGYTPLQACLHEVLDAHQAVTSRWTTTPALPPIYGQQRPEDVQTLLVELRAGHTFNWLTLEHLCCALELSTQAQLDVASAWLLTSERITDIATKRIWLTVTEWLEEADSRRDLRRHPSLRATFDSCIQQRRHVLQGLRDCLAALGRQRDRYHQADDEDDA